MTTKIYCDIADLKLIKHYNKKKIVKGFTTNPSLMRKAGANNYTKYSKKILSIVKKPISFEVFADDEFNILKQANEISKWGNNVYVKIPITNSKGKYLLNVIKKLSTNKIKLNITAVYNFKNVKKILNNIKKNSNVIISIFAGRAGDTGKDPLPELIKSIKAKKNYKNVKILWASVREPYNYIQAKQIGCDIITIPPTIIDKIEKFGKSYKKLTIETVRGFLIDSKKSKFKI
tara:strand:- start:400 stop:1095 length:696 start_codon:yes stop_codon:yes gene_type:complete